MAKYNYNKKVLKGLSVGPFLHEVKTRNIEIEKGKDVLPNPTYNVNKIAQQLHPSVQYGVVSKIIEHKNADAKTYIIKPDEEKGCTELAYFRAGQYISVELNIGEAKVNKAYTLSSSPKDAMGKVNNTYSITVKRTPTGFGSKHILDDWKVGTKVTMSAPEGDFYYTYLRDPKHIIALAGGSGITPFISMAYAISEGIEDFNLTIIYGSRNSKSILLKEELDKVVAASKGKVKVVHVLSEEELEGYEHGFITADLIKKYAGKDKYTINVCGPKAMYNFLEKEIAKLNLPLRNVRFEVAGEYGDPTNDKDYPKDVKQDEFNVKVLVRGEEYSLKCRKNQTLIDAIERAGIRVPSHCRSGECGWCHSRLVSGDVYIPSQGDGRRLADKKFNWIHPCASFPISDIVIEVFPLLERK